MYLIFKALKIFQIIVPKCSCKRRFACLKLWIYMEPNNALLLYCSILSAFIYRILHTERSKDGSSIPNYLRIKCGYATAKKWVLTKLTMGTWGYPNKNGFRLEDAPFGFLSQLKGQAVQDFGYSSEKLFRQWCRASKCWSPIGGGGGELLIREYERET